MVNLPPAPRAIDRALISSADDESLEYGLMSYVLVLQERDPGSVGALPLSLQAHFVAFVLDGQVLRGGFNQLMFNAPEIASMAPDAFIQLEMDEAAVIAQDAWHLYDLVRDKHEQAKAAGRLEPYPATWDEPLLKEVDEAYTAAANRFRTERVAYIRSHPEEFLHP